MVFSFFPLCLPICHDLPIFFHRIWHGVYPCSSHGCHCFLLCSPMVLDGLRLKVFVDSYTVFNDCYLYFFDFYMVFIRFCLVFLDFYEASLIFTWFSSLLYGSHWFLKKKTFTISRFFCLFISRATFPCYLQQFGAEILQFPWSFFPWFSQCSSMSRWSSTGFHRFPSFFIL